MIEFIVYFIIVIITSVATLKLLDMTIEYDDTIDAIFAVFIGLFWPLTLPFIITIIIVHVLYTKITEYMEK